MTRSEYLAELRARLQRLSAEDIEAAVEFYEEYFEDAGDDETAIQSLDSPARVAAQILAESSAQVLNEQSVSPYLVAAELQTGVSELMASMPQTGFPDYFSQAEAPEAAAEAEADVTDTAPDLTEPAHEQPQADNAPQPDAAADAGQKEDAPAQARAASSGYTRDSYHHAAGAPAAAAQSNTPEAPAGTAAPQTAANPAAYTRASYSPYAGGSRNAYQVNANAPQSPYTTPQGRQSSLSAIWYVVLGIFALPVALPLAIAALVLIVMLVVLCVGLVIAFFGVIVALVVAAVGSVISFFSVGTGSISVGAAFVLFGLALMLIPLLIWFTVWLVRAVGKVSAKLFNKLKARSADNEKK